MSHNHITPLYPWYNPSRISAWRSTGEGEAMARLLIKNRPLLVASLEQIELELPHNEILQESDTQEVEVVEELSTQNT
ncbi:MAG: hypothetical protein SNG10_04395, partial [Rikenellaceae bacterium]